MKNDSSDDHVSFDEERIRVAKQVDLANNVQARIQNLFRDIPRPTLLKQVETFVVEKGLQDKTDLFKKGALIAQNPSGFEHLVVLTEDDKIVIRRETTHKWSQPKHLYLTELCSALSPLQSRWGQTGLNGANSIFPIVLNISTADDAPNASVNQMDSRYYQFWGLTSLQVFLDAGSRIPSTTSLVGVGHSSGLPSTRAGYHHNHSHTDISHNDPNLRPTSSSPSPPVSFSMERNGLPWWRSLHGRPLSTCTRKVLIS